MKKCIRSRSSILFLIISSPIISISCNQKTYKMYYNPTQSKGLTGKAQNRWRGPNCLLQTRLVIRMMLLHCSPSPSATDITAACLFTPTTTYTRHAPPPSPTLFCLLSNVSYTHTCISIYYYYAILLIVVHVYMCRLWPVSSNCLPSPNPTSPTNPPYFHSFSRQRWGFVFAVTSLICVRSPTQTQYFPNLNARVLNLLSSGQFII